MDLKLINYRDCCKGKKFEDAFAVIKSEEMNINYQNDNGISFLQVAAVYHHIAGVEWLLGMGVDVNVKDKDGNSCLNSRNVFRCLELVQLLLNAGADVNSTNLKGDTPIANNLYFIAKYLNSTEADHFDFILMLLRAGGDPSIQNKLGKTCFDLIVNYTYGDILRLLFLAKDNLNLQDPSNGNTLIHYAVSYQLQNLVKYLMSLGADQNIQNSSGNTALHIATNFESKHLFSLLRNDSINLDLQNAEKKTALDLAICNGKMFATSQLLAFGANMEIRGEYGYTAIHWVAHKSSVEALQLLIKFGADLNLKNDFGFTALHLSVLNQHLEITKLLCKSGVDLNSQDNNEETPLHLAVKDFDKGVEILIESGADLFIENKYCKTAIDYLTKHYLSTMKRLSSTCQQTIADRIAIKLTREQESCIN